MTPREMAALGAILLVADDEPAIVAVLTDVLASEGYRVLGTGDGRAARAAFHREQPDLLITDQMMPHLTGPDLIALLQAHPGPTIPMILTSAAVPGLLPPPPVAFLPKPFALDALLPLVAGILAQL